MRNWNLTHEERQLPLISTTVTLSPALSDEDLDVDSVAGISRIDGAFSDWREEQLLARDAKGDATAPFDVTKLAARTNGSQLFLHSDIGHDINLQNGAASDGTLRLVVELPDQRVSWSQLDFACLPTYASDKYELQLDLDEFGLHAGDTIKLYFSGSDRLDEPALVRLDKGRGATIGILTCQE